MTDVMTCYVLRIGSGRTVHRGMTITMPPIALLAYVSRMGR